MAAIRIAVISDQHYFTKSDGTPPSHVRLSAEPSEQRCPVRDLRHLITKEGLAAEILACPGDITYRADMQALDIAWRDLVDFQKLLKADNLLVATGNHDVNSRLRGTAEATEPVEHLKLLEPPYPAATHDEDRVRYFGSHVLKVDSKLGRLVILNTCSDHGTGQEAMYERGSYSVSMKRALESAIGHTWSPELGVLICHHHPMLHSEAGTGSYDVMQRGDQLMSTLERTGPWLVIHGHKHTAQLRYGHGGGASPVVFAAGSLSFVNTQSGGGRSNQFYIIEAEVFRGALFGRVKAWTWTTTTGWQPSAQSEEVPDDARFGCRRAPEAVAEDVAAVVTQEVPITWSTLVAQVPDVDRLIPRDRKRLYERLQRFHDIEIDFNELGQPSKVGKSRA